MLPLMTPAAGILRDEIARSGPIPFQRFMAVALYHPGHGYYRRERDPFGKGGDYYTAEQLQPVFGILIARRIRMLFEEMGRSAELSVVELGAGRGEMASAFSAFRYFPVEMGRGEWPERFEGVVFANEFFDALPVRVAARRGDRFREMLVSWSDGRFVWQEGGDVDSELKAYLDRYAAGVEEDGIVEVSLDALRWIEKIGRRLERGYALLIDYGYTARELIRFPRGTLMSYRRHVATEDVLADPGDRDITAHVCFTALQQHGARNGIETVRLESLAQTLLAAGEADRFAEALAAPEGAERFRRRMQLKTLLAGMGQTFRTLLLRKRGKK